jgi:2-keto-4-pentenoate hydratase
MQSEAYAVQRSLIDVMRDEYNRKLIGWKIGATTAVAQKRMNLQQPFFGPLFDADVLRDNTLVATSMGRLRGVEAEYAFKFSRTLQSDSTSPISANNVIDCVASVRYF